jgi:hypothetical protein
MKLANGFGVTLLDKLDGAFEPLVAPIEIVARTLIPERRVADRAVEIEVEKIDCPSFAVATERAEMAARDEMLVSVFSHTSLSAIGLNRRNPNSRTTHEHRHETQDLRR